MATGTWATAARWSRLTTSSPRPSTISREHTAMRNSHPARPLRSPIAAAVALGAVGLVVTFTEIGVDAHKAKTSPFTYNADIFPILRDKCGRCHVEGGSAPMSLMTYDTDGGAVAWAESIREMLLSGAMPPWYADPTGPAVRNSHRLSPRELDKVITWATGGTPHGNLAATLPPVPAPHGWNRGKPDLELPLPTPFTVEANVMEATREETVATNFAEARWVKAVDLLPGVPSMVRRAYVSVDGGPMLALWEPGSDAVEPPPGAAFQIPAHATLHVKIDYKKSWQDEQKPLEDRSVVGLYFTTAPPGGKAIQSVSIDGPAGGAGEFAGTVAAGGRIVALRPLMDAPYAIVDITAVDSTGRSIPLLKLRNI